MLKERVSPSAVVPVYGIEPWRLATIRLDGRVFCEEIPGP
jgi:hypothetical protein